MFRFITILLFAIVMNINLFAQYSLVMLLQMKQEIQFLMLKITLLPEDIYIQSDDNGYYIFESVNAGVHTLSVSLLGYEDYEYQVSIFSDTKFDVFLTNKSYKLKDIYITTMSEKICLFHIKT
ncbi:MAG: carboxypeptidase-like regulatory domain-containing protein [Saprospiraceae bacterium]